MYVISVAAELAGVHPQTLRIYERKGLLGPTRTAGQHPPVLRARHRAAADDPAAHAGAGLNLAGVKMIVEMENELDGCAGAWPSWPWSSTGPGPDARGDGAGPGHRPQAAIVPAASVRTLGLGHRRAVPSDADRPPGGPIAMGPARP